MGDQEGEEEVAAEGVEGAPDEGDVEVTVSSEGEYDAGVGTLTVTEQDVLEGNSIGVE